VLSFENVLARCQWLMFVILAIWEAEIRRIAFPANPGGKNLEDPISVVHTCHSRNGRKVK
jgi:hypothetical protein